MTTPIYQDPALPRERPDLVDGLMGQATKPGQHPLENQCTEVLAWLVDRSHPFAKGFSTLFISSDVVDSAEVIGARTQLSLPALPTTGVLRPDLSVEGSGGSFQLLIEVKVASTFGEYQHGDGVILQPEAYIAAWQAAREPVPARVRAVGTLTRDGTGPLAHRAGPMRAPDVNWSEVRDLLADLLTAGALDADVILVAESLRSALDARVVKPSLLPPEQLARWLEERRPIVQAVLAALRKRMTTSSEPSAVKLSSQFVGGYLPFIASNGDNIALWVFATPAGGVCNRPGIPDALCVAPVADSQSPVAGDLAIKAAAGGFQPGKDFGGYPGPRHYFDLGRLEEIDDPEARVGSVAEWTIRAMHQGGLLLSSADLVAAGDPKAETIMAIERATGMEYIGHADLGHQPADD